MKPLVLYYSYSGNNKNLAEVISKKLNCPLEEITEKKKRNMFTFVKEIFFRKPPVINDINKNIRDFDHIILIAPLWMGIPGSPMITFLKKFSGQIRDYSFISLCGGSLGPNKNCEDFLRNKFNKEPKVFSELYINDIAGMEDKGKPDRIMKIKVGAGDIEKKYKDKIDKFLASIN